MTSFNVPPRITNGLDNNSTLVQVNTAAAKALTNASPEALELLDIQAKWAMTALIKRLSVTNARHLLNALRRLEFANLEIARRDAVVSPNFEDWKAALSIDLIDAMETELDVTTPNFEHRRFVVDALNALRRFEQDMSRLDNIIAGKGKKGGQRKLTSA